MTAQSSNPELNSKQRADATLAASRFARSHRLTNHAEDDMSISPCTEFPMSWLAIPLPLMLAICAQDVPNEKERPYWLPVAKEFISQVEISPRTDQPQPFAREPEPIFHHIQSVRGNSVGSVFLFTEPSGRPASVNDVFFLTYGKKTTMYHEFHSLSSGPLTYRSASRVLGETQGPGLVWHEIPDAGVPADKPAARDRQIRLLSRRFTAHLIYKQQDRFELRLLTTPLYRFDATGTKECLGGALTVFCQETDPEIFLLIEARRTGDGYKWMYAAAEFSNLSLFLKLDDTEVWSADPPFRRGGHWGGIVREVELPMPEAKTGDKL
jgi:hypothetical protein